MFLFIYRDAVRVKTSFGVSILTRFKTDGVSIWDESRETRIMRRKDKEIRDSAEIESIISRSMVCRLAMADKNRPYIIPLCFGYKDHTLYFHSAGQGKKIDVLKKNNLVCFEFDIDYEPIKSDNACEWGMKYKSVIGFGTASFIEDFESKRRALDIITQHYSGESFDYPEAKLKHTVIIKVNIEHMTGKYSEPGINKKQREISVISY